MDRKFVSRVQGFIVLVALALLTPLPAGSGEMFGRSLSNPALGGEITLPQWSYFRATRIDPRLCPSPLCGGVFVERVNKMRTRCADGDYREECHAAAVDFSALHLAPAEESALQADFAAGHVLARGKLEEVDAGIGIPIPTLIVEDAWSGVTGTRGDRGRFYGVLSSGILCITYPCPSLIQLRLNSRGIRYLHELDLSPSGATNEEIADGLSELHGGDGLLVFGTQRKFKGPAGKGRRLLATEFYTKVDEGGPVACGGFTYPPNPSCMPDEFCEAPAGTCFVADLPGTCQVAGDLCPLYIDPVCGCDGVTYGNDCERQRARVSLDHRGACGSPPNCGTATCGAGEYCCNPLLGICAPEPFGVCIQ